MDLFAGQPLPPDCLLLSAYCLLVRYEHPLVDPQFRHL